MRDNTQAMETTKWIGVSVWVRCACVSANVKKDAQCHVFQIVSVSVCSNHGAERNARNKENRWTVINLNYKKILYINFPFVIYYVVCSIVLFFSLSLSHSTHSISCFPFLFSIAKSKWTKITSSSTTNEITNALTAQKKTWKNRMSFEISKVFRL